MDEGWKVKNILIISTADPPLIENQNCSLAWALTISMNKAETIECSNYCKELRNENFRYNFTTENITL